MQAQAGQGQVVEVLSRPLKVVEVLSGPLEWTEELQCGQRAVSCPSASESVSATVLEGVALEGVGRVLANW